MLICIPTMDRKGLEGWVSPHFGRAETFTFVDTDSNAVRVIDNTGQHQGGALTPAQLISQEGSHLVLCSGLGPRAVKVFEQAGIEVFIGASGTVEEALEAYRSGILKEATDKDACQEHRH
jgi:predicted Fe-Mo cluster-binding NifX family protein